MYIVAKPNEIMYWNDYFKIIFVMNINNILKELYSLDPELKKHEQDLVIIINKLLKSRPDTKFDEKFAKL